MANSNKLKMKTKFNGILTLLLAFVVQLTFAQEKTISGTVVDETNMPLPGATVLIKGTTTGASTDFDGKYSISANAGDVLTFSYVGYADQNITIGSSNTIDVSLALDSSLDEVVIEAGAYDIKKAKPLTNTASAVVSAETIESRPNTSAIQTLQGQTAGLNITTGSGQPGSQSDILIRGVGSINGSTEPLFIIDGTPATQSVFRNINSNDIASVTVLKDAGATAIYGNRGTNGVIIVNTKKAKRNSGLKINYTGLTSISTFQGDNYDRTNSAQELELQKRYGVGDGASLSDEEVAALADINTDWNDVFLRKAITQSHTIGIAAGGENVTNYTSFGYIEQEGVVKKSGLKRFNFKNNLDGRSKNNKFNYGSNVAISYVKNDIITGVGGGGVNQNVLLGAQSSLTYLEPSAYQPVGADILVNGFKDSPYFLMDLLNFQTNYEEELNIIGGLNGSYKLTENITANARLNGNYTSTNTLYYRPTGSFNADFFAEPGNNFGGYQDQGNIRTFVFNYVNSLNYSKTFAEKHTLNLGLYTEYLKAHYRQFGVRANGLYSGNQFPGDGSGFVADNPDNDWFADSASSNRLDSGLFSYFGNLDYDYSNKYGIGATLRRDASSRFTGDNKWGTFWSVSGRWNIDKESFMDNTAFNMLKLRASYGTTGNQEVNGTGYFNGLTLTEELYGFGTAYGGNPGVLYGSLPNPDLKWETTAQTNIGLDFNVWSKLSGSLDFYNRKTTDLFTSQAIQSVTGSSFRNQNQGELINKGVELNLRYKILNNNNGWNFSVNANGSYNKNERYGADNASIEEGAKIGQYYVVRYAGVNPGNGELLYYDIDGNITDNPNVDTDRVFTDKNSLPDYQGAFGTDLEYKGFFLQTQFNYAIGVDRFDVDYANIMDPSDIGTFRHSKDLLNAWTPENTNTNVPSLNASNLQAVGATQSDRFLVDADYLRLRFASIGYKFDKTTLDRLKLSNLRVFLNGENLLTFSKWRGYDAEGFAAQGRSYPTPRTFALGLEVGF